MRTRRIRRARQRLADMALALAILAALALVAARGWWLEPDVLSGPARIVDGDTLAIEATRVRLAGIDAPEIGQNCQRDSGAYDCGKAAREALERLAGGRAVTCRGDGHDRYGRFLGYCEAGGVDVNRAMVAQGWAVAYGSYYGAEREARGGGRGIWAGSFDLPGDWRRMHGGLVEDEHGGILARLSGFSIWRYFE